MKYSAISNEETAPPLRARISDVDRSDVDGITTDQAPLLGDAIAIEEDSEQATASYSSCTINLANTILGTGMLAMPAAIASVGLIFGSFMVFFAALASGSGLYLLSRVAAHTRGRHASFFAASKLTYPTAALLFDLAIAIKCFGVAISYLIIIGDLMPQVIAGSIDSNLIWEEHTILLDRRFWITAFMIVIIPLAFLRRLDSLRYTSGIALFAVVYLLFIVVHYYYGPEYQAPPKDKIQLVRLSSDFFTHLPIFVFSFTCHQNIFTVYNELEDNSQANINSVITGAVGTSTGVYQVVGILGYLSFGQDVSSNIISEYKTSTFVTIGRAAIVILVLFSYPLQAHPCRASLDKVLSMCADLFTAPNPRHKLPSPPSSSKYFLMTSGILLSSYLIAILVSKLDLVLAFVGSTGSTTISFILPGMFYYKIYQNGSWTRLKILSVLLIGYGFAVMTICLSMNIYRVITAQPVTGH